MKKKFFVLNILTALVLITTSNVIRAAKPHFSQPAALTLASGITSSEDDPELGSSTEILTVNALKGNNCTNATNLSQITSPYNGSTTPASNSFSFCEMGWSKDLISYYDLQDGDGIKIWQSWNNFDTRHTLRWSGACPGDIEIVCIDDPDFTPVTWINTTGETQRVWFIIAGYGSGHGNFTLEWELFNCEPYQAPFSEDFDLAPELPVCWTYSGSGDYHTGYVSDWYSYSWPNSFYIYQNWATTVLSTPQIAEPVNTLRLSFWAMVEYGDDQLKVGTLSNPNDLNTFSEYQTLNLTNDWQKHTVNLIGYQGNDPYIGLQYGSNNNYGSIYIDDISIEFAPSCIEPHNLTVSNITTSEAGLGWEQWGEAESWNIEWGMAGYEPGTGTLITGITENEYLLTGLDAGTSYEFYVQADCGSGDLSDWSLPLKFSTLCELFDIPFGENFDSSSELPACWTFTGAGFYYSGYVTFMSSHSWPNSFYFNQNWATAMLSTPQIAEPLHTLRLSFWAMVQYGDEQLKIGTLSDPEDLNAFNELQTLNLSNDWQKHVVYFNDYQGTDSYLGIRYGNNADYGAIFIDDIMVQFIPSCAEPQNLAASDITTSEARLGWIQWGEAVSWNLEWGLAGFEQGTGTLISGITENEYLLTGLDAGTFYDFYVQADCGGGDLSDWSSKLKFSTLCDLYEVPFSENFDSAPDLPICWTFTGEGWYFTGKVINWLSHSLPNSFYISQSEAATLLSTPPIAEPVHNLRISFWANLAYGDEQLRVGAVGNPDDLNTFNELQTLNLSDNWQKYIVYFNDYQGSGSFIGIQYGNNSDYGLIFIDDIVVQLIPSCVEPHNLMVTEITISEAGLGWDQWGEVLSWNIEWGLAGFEQGAGALITGITENNYILAGLEAATHYEFYVQADCGNNDLSDWSLPMKFTTLCNPFEVPFTENFDSSSELPACWTFSGDGLYSGYITDWTFYSWPHSFFVIQDWSTTLLSTPQLAEPVQTLRLSFWALIDFGEEQLRIGTLSDPDDISTFSEYLTLNLSYNWQNYVVTFSDYQGTDTHIGLLYGSNSDYGGIFIDDISVEFISAQYAIVAMPNNPAWGSVEGAGLYEHGEMVTLSAIAASNYKFIEWQEGGVTVSTDSVYVFTALHNRTLVAIFDFVEGVSQISGAATRVILYPNPASKLITISMNKNPKGIESIIVVDMFGNEVISVMNPAKADFYSLDISRLNPGAYVVRIVATEGIANKRLIVK